jgi:hypothetical protein
VRRALAAESVPEMRFEFDSKGAEVIVNDPFLDGDDSRGIRWSLVWAESDSFAGARDAGLPLLPAQSIRGSERDRKSA